jgi:hypothetical protein
MKIELMMKYSFHRCRTEIVFEMASADWSSQHE